MRDTVLRIVERSTAARLPGAASWLRSFVALTKASSNKKMAISVSGPLALSRPNESCWSDQREP